MNTHKHRFIFAFICVLFNLAASAQEKRPLTIQRLGKEYGLTESYISDIVQDQRGVYWMSGINGLVMFDGQTSKRFNLPFYKDKILSSNILGTLYLENDSMLWIAHSQGVCQFNVYTHIFSPMPIEKDYPSQSINFSVIRKDGNGTVWLSTRELGILVFDSKKKIIRRTEIPVISNLNRVRNILVLDKEHLLFCHNKGHLLLNSSSGKEEGLSSHPLTRGLADPFFKGNAGDAYIEKQLSYFTIRQKDNPFYSTLLHNTTSGENKELPIQSAFGFKYFKDSHNNIWIFNDAIYLVEATSGKLVSIDPGKKDVFSQCFNLYEDKDKNIWFCTNNGVYVMEADKIILENSNELIKDEYVSHVNTCIAKFNKEYWVGTYGEGLVVLDSNCHFKRNIDLTKLSSYVNQNFISCIYSSKNGKHLWTGCVQGGLSRFDKTTNKFSFYEDTLFLKQHILVITEDPRGQMYFGTKEGRIVSYDEKTNTFKLIYNERTHKKNTIDFISGLIFTSENVLYVSTSFNGLYKLTIHSGDTKAFKLDPENPNSIKSNDLYCMNNFGKKGFYFGSTNGLLHFDPLSEKFSSFTPEEGLPFSEIYCMTPYENAAILAGTSDGLYRINFEEKTYAKIGSDSPVEKIGFSSMFFEPEKKKIILCTDEYVYSLYYEKRTTTYVPASHIFSLKTHDTIYNFSEKLPEKLRLKRNQNSFTLKFGSAGYKYSERFDYYYKIEELSDDWQLAGKLPEVSFNNLKGGNYTFRFKTVNKNTKDEVDQLSFNFEIKKAFYETLWFYVLIVCAVLSIFYGIYRIRINKLLAVEKVRVKLSRDLHDDIGSTLSTINILSSIAGKKISSDPETTGDYLEKISSNSQEIMENMGDIVWSINPANDSIQQVISKMREFATTILEPKNIMFDLQVKEELNAIHLKMEYRRDLFLIYKEAINNAAKYSNCSRVKVSLFLKNKTLTLQIADNGKGFDIDVAKNGNGLTNMNRRAKAIRGSLSMSSAPGEGTTITLEVPISLIS